MNKESILRIALPVAAVVASVGIGFAGVSSAQSASSTVNASSSGAAITQTVPTVQGAQRPHGHMPLGQDGNVTAISGTTITMQEEADEGAAIYTVDASAATFQKDGASAAIGDIKVGDKIFVQGTVSGTSVSATSVSLGHPQGIGRDLPEKGDTPDATPGVGDGDGENPNQ